MTAVINHTDSGVGIVAEMPLEVGCQVEAVQGDDCTATGLYLGSRAASVVLLNAAGDLLEVPNAGQLRVIADAEPAMAPLVRALAREALMRRCDHAENEAWKARLVERAHEEADSRDWCSDFDDLLSELDLPRRSRDYELNVYFSGRVTVTVNDATEEGAAEQVDSDMVLSAVRDAMTWGGFEPEITDVS